MKHQITITLEEETLLKLNEKLRSVKYSSRSHAIECALESFLEEPQ